MTSPAEHIHPNAELADAAADMATKRLGCLPVIETGELVGIVTRADVLAVLAQYPVDYRAEKAPPSPPPVAAIMYPEPIAARGDELLMKVAARMAAVQARHACVVDAEGKVIGIVSDRDVRRVIGEPARALEIERLPDSVRALRVELVMNRNPQTIEQDQPFTKALPMLVHGRVGAMPVVDDHGHLRGILSYIDVLKALAMYVP
jgi:CBS domain-containing protein